MNLQQLKEQIKELKEECNHKGEPKVTTRKGVTYLQCPVCGFLLDYYPQY